VSVADFLVALSLVLFLFFFNRFIQRLRPAAVADLVGQEARQVITSVTEAAEAETAPAAITASDPVLVVSSRGYGSIQAIDVRGLVTWASRHGCLLAVHAAVGDFVTTGRPMIAISGGGTVPVAASRRLQRMIVLGVERSVEQDAAFSFRIMADIAAKALSAAINDPAAVQVLDHLENVLRLVGSTPLHGRLTFRDREGTPRLVMPGPT
jgi:uncharacterized membrane protein